MANTTSDRLSELKRQKYLSLESYRKNGVGVRTPVWFAASSVASSDADTEKLYVYTTADSGKAKRIRRTAAVKIAACDARGKVTGSWIDARAEIVTGEEFGRGMRLLNRKYRPWKQILDMATRLFPRHERIVLVIRPLPQAGAGAAVSDAGSYTRRRLR